jgi:hypothetical protein
MTLLTGLTLCGAVVVDEGDALSEAVVVVDTVED